MTWRRPRTDALRSSLIVWGGWLLVTGVVFSFASGIIHPYYTVALAPAIAALVGIGVVELWRRRLETNQVARWLLVALVAVTAVWTYQLLGRASWHPELRWIALGAGALAIVALLVPVLSRAVIVAPLVALALLLAPAAYAVQTASTSHTGALPSAGPAATTSFAGFGGGRGAFGGGATRGGSTGAGGFGGGSGQPGGSASRVRRIRARPTRARPTRARPRAVVRPPAGSPADRVRNAPVGHGPIVGRRRRNGWSGWRVHRRFGSAGSRCRGTRAATPGSPPRPVTTRRRSLELATGDSVMAIGGYNGTDNATTLARFAKLVQAGKIHYYVGDSSGFIGSTAADTSVAYRIQQWVAKNYTSTTIGGTTVYDLTTSS